MTIWTDLQSAIEAKITALGYTGTLANLGIDQPYAPSLRNLLDLQTALYGVTGSIGGASVDTNPTTFAVSTICLNTALVEASIAFVNAKKIAIYSRTNTAFRLSTISGNTINTQNFEAVLSGNEYLESGINFTGSYFFSAETLPTLVTVLACATTNGSANVTSANSFSSAVIGQAVAGTGVPANTFVIRRAADGLSITLGNASGATVNATATGSVSLAFSGAVIRIARWT